MELLRQRQGGENNLTADYADFRRLGWEADKSKYKLATREQKELKN
jgi:hypothetical protein